MSDVTDVLIALREELHRAPSWISAAAGNAEVVVDGPELCADLSDTLRARTAVRFYSSTALAGEFFEGLAERLAKVDRMLAPTECETSPLTFMLFARNIKGFAPGAYELSPRQRRLVATAEDFALREIVLQPEFAESAAIVLAVGSLEASESGSHAYRRLLVRGGAVMEAAWLDAVAHGLAGSIFAGFLPSTLRRMQIIDGYRRIQILALALGVPQSER